MRICYLGENGSVHNQKWIDAFSQLEGIELHVISFNRGPRYPGVRYHYMSTFTGSKLDYLLNIPKVRSLVRKLKPDVLHAQYATSYGFIGARCGFHPYVITGWGADIFDSSKNALIRLLLRYSLSKADVITVLSQITKKKLSELTGLSATLIPFGVDTFRFKPTARKGDDYLRIGTIRTLTEKYGVEFLIRAFAIIHHKHPRTILEIVGDGALRQSLEDLTLELGIREKVIFHGFISQQHDFAKYYSILSQLDIFAIMSIMDSETFGVACVEAGACGIPVVATSVGGLPEVVIDGVTGIIVAPADPTATASALDRLISDASLRRRMGEAGRENAVENYDWNNCVQKMVSLYRSL